ncbi:MAG: tape measure protein, partial [Acinetobacter sp.]
MTVQQSTLVITVNARSAQRDIERLDRSLLDLGTQGDRTSRGMGSSLSSLTAYMAGLLSVATAISKVDAYTSMQNRLKLVTATQKELNQATNDTFAIAQRTAQAWEGVVQVYQRFADNAKVLGISLKQVASLTDTVSKSIAISGSTASSAEAALVQFGQALASGVLRGEEFNSISEQAPGLLKAIATGLGVNIGELRAMANQGKLTGDVVIKALDKAKGSVDNLFSKTDFTIAQSFTQLNNATIKFVGEAGKANGAASLLSNSIRSLADNLDTIANIAVLGGVAFLTKTISAQVLATQAAIAATIARRASLVAEIEAQVQLAAVEIARTRQVTALALTEVNLARAEYNAALSAEARAAAIMRLTQAEIAHNLAINRNTAALAAQVAVQNTLNASTAVGSRVMSFLGGPVGLLTIAVTALAGGYLFMKNRTEEANQKLKEQMEIAAKTREELLALQGVQKDVAVNELKDAFEKQNVSLRKLNNEYLGFIDNVGRGGKQSKAVYEIFELARKGAITNAEALERLNKLNVLTPEQKRQGLDLVNNYMLQAQETLKAEKALNVFGVQVKLSGNAAENAAQKVNLNTDSMDDNAEAAKKATQAQKDYLKSVTDRTYYAEYKRIAMEQYGLSKEQAEELAKAREAAGGMGKEIGSENVKAALGAVAAEKKYNDVLDARKDAIKDAAKAEREAAAQRKREAKEAERTAKEFARERSEIIFEYSDAEAKKRIELEREVSRLQKYGLNEYIDIAKNKYKAERELYDAQLAYELFSHNLTEEGKLNAELNIAAKRVRVRADLTDKEKKSVLLSEKQKYDIELSNIQLAKKQRIFEATEFQYSEMDRIAERYKLEREEISKTHTEAERNILLQASLAKQNKEEAEVKDQAISDYASILGFEENPLVKQFAVIDELRKQDLINDEQYQRAKVLLQAKYTSAQMESLFSGLASMVDENSKTYAVLFAAQKAFAVAQAVMAAPVAYSKAYNAVIDIPYVGPYLAPAAG